MLLGGNNVVLAVPELLVGRNVVLAVPVLLAGRNVDLLDLCCWEEEMSSCSTCVAGRKECSPAVPVLLGGRNVALF